MALSVLNPDIWYLILEQVKSRKDLCNVCLTSRDLLAMATPHLYRVVPLEAIPLVDLLERRCRRSSNLNEARNDLLYFAHSLFTRLQVAENEQLRNAVQELEFGCFNGADVKVMEDRLVALLDCLPNLRRIKIKNRLTDKALQDLVGHSKRVSLHLLHEDGKRPVEKDLQNVVVLKAWVRPCDDWKGPNQDILGIQKLLFACPNLTSFSLDVIWPYGGCVIWTPRHNNVYSFQFSGNETFPPLEELSLDGFRLGEAEQEQWRRKSQWSRLMSLNLGPQYTADFLNVAAGCATSLRSLTVQVYDGADSKPDCPPLELFLMTFTSLESLTVKGYHLPIVAVGNHPGLKHLCLHSFEPAYVESRRPTLDAEQLQELDKVCPHLETLELDLYRDGRWPEHIFKALATGFRKLRKLTLHLELGIRAQGSMEPKLTKSSAMEIGQQFFKWRSHSNLSLLALKTGEPLRRYPQREPEIFYHERKEKMTVEVHKPSNVGDVPEDINFTDIDSEFHSDSDSDSDSSF